MIHFDKDRMAAVMAAHEAWWDGKLDRPLVKICITDAYPAEKDPPVPLLSQANCHDFSIPVDALLDTIELSLTEIKRKKPDLNDQAFIMDLQGLEPGADRL